MPSGIAPTTYNKVTSRLIDKMNKLFLIDAYALIFKFYYAFANNPMRNSAGMNTSAIYGFTKFINDIITRERPQYLGVAFDPPGGNFRHKLYPEYKANRAETPEDIKISTPHIKRILDAMGIPVLEVAGYEADDVIGTITSKAACNGFEVYMVTPDKDYGQLIRDCAYMYKPSRSGEGVEIVGKDKIMEQYGFEDPFLIRDMLALWGDVSDNIPGIPGVGEKTACKLLKQWGNIEGIIENIDQIKGKVGQNIAANLEALELSRTLVTIEQNVPIDFEPDKLKVESPHYGELRNIYIEMGFRSLLKDIDYWQRAENIEPDMHLSSEGELLLFDMGEAPKPKQEDPSSQVKPIELSAPLSLFDMAPTLSNIDSNTHNYQNVTGSDNIKRLVEIIKLSGEMSIATHTTSLDVRTATLVGISIAVEPHKAYHIPVSGDTQQITEYLAPLAQVLEAKHIDKIGQNLKYDIQILQRYGLRVAGFLFDTMVMNYTLEPSLKHSLEDMAEKYLSYTTIPIESLIGRGASARTLQDIDPEKVALYGSEKADITLRLRAEITQKLKESNLWDLYVNIEEPLISILSQMEMRGITLDCSLLGAYSNELKAELATIEERVREVAGDKININSPKQLGELLFEKLKITDKPKRTKTKQYKTDEEYLLSLRDKHPIIDDILEYRGVKKLLTTYVDALPALVDSQTGRLHTTYNQALVATGRLSSTNPNLQNIPIRDKRGQKIREAFVAPSSEYTLLAADYSQVELRIMAHLCGDEHLTQAFNNEEDIHSATAAKIFGVEPSEVTKEQRRVAKTANFGIIYGISSFGLAQRLDIAVKEAKEIIDNYFASYPAVKAYMDNTITKARELGYSQTIYGRRRMLEDINSSNAMVRGYAERNAINAPIQGAAADIIKMAMHRCADMIKESGLDCKLLLQVHDELIFEVKKEQAQEAAQIITKAMEGAAELSVPLTVEVGVGDNWLVAH